MEYKLICFENSHIKIEIDDDGSVKIDEQVRGTAKQEIEYIAEIFHLLCDTLELHGALTDELKDKLNLEMQKSIRSKAVV